MIDLKPCPFCGASLTKFTTGFLNVSVAVICQVCGSVGPRCSTPEKAIYAWNKRVKLKGLTKCTAKKQLNG